MHRSWAVFVAVVILVAVPGLATAEGNEVIHVVAPKENLFRISLRYGVSISEIMKANNLEDANRIWVGQRLRIPKDNGPSPSQAPSPETANPTTQGEPIAHQVQTGENLFRLSLRYQVRLADIMDANGLTDPNRILVGQALIIPIGGQSQHVESPSSPVHTAENDGDGELFRITYYCLVGPMSSGRWVYSGAAAADQGTFPMGTKLLVEGRGEFVVEDRFAWDAAARRLDIWVPTCYEAVQRGVEYRRVVTRPS
ncbi:MAG: LysM peptidoglycan-binding domain-containing protein [Chloroflexi bacterium]|nr:LysM peptidoglycan-binding domain-containing protein [Chloroflexota bacterium]